MKITRPGNTEFHLIFAQYCEDNHNLSYNEIIEINNIKSCYIDWLYKTAGYYDTNIAQLIHYRHPEHYTPLLKEFIYKMMESLKNSDYFYGKIWMLTHCSIYKYFNNFVTFLSIKHICNGLPHIYTIIPHIQNKRVLIISSFSELIEQQINNGNVSSIQPSFNSSTFITYKFPYMFMNSGPDNNSFETLQKISNDIKENYNDFDIALLSCGCYGSFLTDMIHTEMRKDAIYVGGILPFYFGIIGKRELNEVDKHYKNHRDKLIIEVPAQYRPDCYKQIEDGCYW